MAAMPTTSAVNALGHLGDDNDETLEFMMFRRRPVSCGAFADGARLFRHAKHAQKEAAEDRLHADDCQYHAPNGWTHRDRYIKGSALPLPSEPQESAYTRGRERSAGDQAAFEVKDLERSPRERLHGQYSRN